MDPEKTGCQIAHRYREELISSRKRQIEGRTETDIKTEALTDTQKQTESKTQADDRESRNAEKPETSIEGDRQRQTETAEGDRDTGKDTDRYDSNKYDNE